MLSNGKGQVLGQMINKSFALIRFVMHSRAPHALASLCRPRVGGVLLPKGCCTVDAVRFTKWALQILLVDTAIVGNRVFMKREEAVRWSL